MAEVRFEQATRIFPGRDAPAVTRSTSSSRTASCSCWSARPGSGKSTALRMLAGLEEVDGGAIYIGGRDVTDIPPKHRDIAMVFQNYALYPYMDVARQHRLPAEDGGRAQGRARAPGAPRRRRCSG